jgi:hypothetical protein
MESPIHGGRFEYGGGGVFDHFNESHATRCARAINPHLILVESFVFLSKNKLSEVENLSRD